MSIPERIPSLPPTFPKEGDVPNIDDLWRSVGYTFSNLYAGTNGFESGFTEGAWYFQQVNPADQRTHAMAFVGDSREGLSSLTTLENKFAQERTTGIFLLSSGMLRKVIPHLPAGTFDPVLALTDTHKTLMIKQNRVAEPEPLLKDESIEVVEEQAQLDASIEIMREGEPTKSIWFNFRDDLLTTPDISVYLFKKNGVASSVVMTSRHENEVSVWNMKTTEELRNQGMGTKLLRHVLYEEAMMGAKEFYLLASHDAREFYSRNGFQPIESIVIFGQSYARTKKE
jgi:GNAT superfamily N-acetyltransferase